MPDRDPNEFTARERCIVNYYRDFPISKARWTRAYDLYFYDLLFALGAVASMIAAVALQELLLGMVGCLLLLGRLYYLVTEGVRTVGDLQSIFTKYDARLKALCEAPKTDDGE